MTMITPSYLGETIEYSSLHACRSTLEDPTALPALAATVVVGTCMPTKVSYDSMTDAVEGVPAGSIIQVCPGVHAEQVVISKSLTLKGITVGNSGYPVITPPPGGLVTNAYGLNVPSFWGQGWGFAAQILIQGGANVTLSDLTLDAMGTNTHCAPPHLRRCSGAGCIGDVEWSFGEEPAPSGYVRRDR